MASLKVLKSDNQRLLIISRENDFLNSCPLVCKCATLLSVFKRFLYALGLCAWFYICVYVCISVCISRIPMSLPSTPKISCWSDCTQLLPGDFFPALGLNPASLRFLLLLLALLLLFAGEHFLAS